MVVHQLLHGYKRGHQLLAGSIQLDSQSDELITRLSDLSGSMTFDLDVVPYLTCYPLPNLKYYAVGKTWLDTSAPRAGCVLTHTLIIPIENWRGSPNPSVFRQLIDRPDNSSDTERYRQALEIDIDPFSSDIPHLQVESDLTVEFVYRFFGEGINPIVWFNESNAEEYFWKFVRVFWPQLRGQFACCTFCLQPRFLEDRPFNLMFAPFSAYSRFQQIQRESIIDRKDLSFSLQTQATENEPWLKKWAKQIMKPSSLSNRLEDDIQDEMIELGSFLSSDPTAVKKLYLVQELRKQSHQLPMAPIGLLDMVESLAPGEDDAIAYKENCLRIALQSIRSTKNLDEALKCSLFLSDRLLRKAYYNVDSKIVTGYHSIIEDYVIKAPDATLQAADRLINTPTELMNSPYAKGIALGLMKIGNELPTRLRILRQYPNWSPFLIRMEPQLGLLFLNSEKHDLEMTNLETLSSWVSKTSDSESLRRIRSVMLSEVKDDRYKSLAVELLRLLDESDVYWVLDTLSKSTSGFSAPEIRKVICAQVSKTYPVTTRVWAARATFWSDETANIAAATYPEDSTALIELIQSTQYDELKKAQVLAAFISIISQGRSLPQWFCEFAKSDTNLLPTLLLVNDNLPDDIVRVIKKILNEVSDIPLTKLFRIEQINAIISANESLSDSLIEAAMKSVISGYIAGDLDWKAYRAWESTNWGENWISAVNSQSLQLIINHNCSKSREAWISGWRWLSNSSQNLYRKNLSLVPILINTLLTICPRDWHAEATDLWLSVMKRVQSETQKSIFIRCSADALNFAFHNTRYPVSKIVIQAFLPVYKAVVESETIPPETYSLFGYFDWDKGKELRRKIIDSFMNSNWPPGDLAVAVREKTLLRKIYSRVRRQWRGKEYIQLMLNDLSRRENDPSVTSTWREFKSLVEQNIYEAWD